MNAKPASDQMELTFALSRRIPGRSERVHADQMLGVFAAFERKLVGVDVRRVETDEAMMRVVVAVRGGADQAYLERLWRGHLLENGLAVDDTR